jgi:hypothetical protein
MKSAWILAAGLAFTQSALAIGAEITGFDPARLHLVGSYCTFERKPQEVVLASDWAGKFWMKVDGEMLELVSHRTDVEAERQLASKRWHESLSEIDLKVELNLVELGRGEDTAAYKGYLDIRRGRFSTRFRVSGGCGA